MPVGFSAGGPKAGALRRRAPVVVPPDPPPTGAIRWISPTGTGNGQSVSTPGSIQNLNQYIGEVGPGGEVRIRADLGDYQIGNTLQIGNGGTAANRVVVRGCDGNGNPMKAQIRKGRTSPWPAAAQGGSPGGTIMQWNSGSNFINWRALHLRDAKLAVLVPANVTGVIWGDRQYRDTAVAALIPNECIFDKEDPGYQALIQQIYTVSAAGVSANIQTHAVDMSNCERGIDVGLSEGSVESLFDFEVYGGTFTGSGQGFFRLRGLGRNYWFQDCTEDGGSGPRDGPNQYLSSDGSNNWGVGFELQARRQNSLALTPAYRTGVCFVTFLRCKANANRDSRASRTYTNGDGFSGESGNDGCIYIRCEAHDNEDGGLETKALNVTVIGFKAYRNKRNFRLWGFADCFHVDVRDGRQANIYTKSSKNWSRVFSGTVSGNPGDAVFQTADDGNVGWLAIDPSVQVTGRTSSPLYLHQAPHGFLGLYNLQTAPINTATPAFTSNGDRRVANNVRDIYAPTFNAPCTREMIDNDPTTDGYKAADGPNGLQSLFYDGNGWEVLMQRTTGETDADKRDVNKDGVYEYDLIGRAANWKKVIQRVRIAVGNVQFPTGPVDPPPDPDPPPTNPITTILARMATAGATPNAARTTLYNNFISVFTANTSAIANKTEQMVWPKSHHANAAKLGWIGADIEQDGTRAFPGFIIDQGYKSATSSQWAYWGGANNANFSSSSIAIAGIIETLPPEVGGVDTRADCFGWSGLNVAVYSSGIISVQVNGGQDIWIDPQVSTPFYVYAERSGSTITVYTKNTLYSTKTNQPINALTAERPRMSSTNGGTAGTATVAFAWMGSPLTASERTAMYNGAVALWTGIGGTVVEPPDPDPVDPGDNPTLTGIPLVAIVGASRFRQGYSQTPDGRDNYIETTAIGQFEWAKVLGANFRLVTFADPTSTANSFNMNGMCFSQDGDRFYNMRDRLPKILASQANVVIVNANVSALQSFDAKVQEYCNEYKDILTQIQAAGKYAVAEQLWERGTAAGGVWSIGTGARLSVPAINAEMATWCAARGIPIIKCRDVLIDINGTYTPNREPLPGYTRGDSTQSSPPLSSSNDTTHLSILGAYVYGKEIRRALEAAWNPPPAVTSATAAGNFVTNPLMTGTGGTLTGITGQLADGYTAAKRGSATTIVAAKVTSAPINTRFGTTAKQWQQFTISGTTNITGGVREGIGNVRTTVTGLTIGKWYEARCKIEVDASNSFSGVSGRVSDSGGFDSRFMSVVDSGGGTGQGSWASNVLPFMNEAWGGMYVSMPWRAGATSATFAFDVGVKNGSNNTVVRFAEWEAREVPDPHLMMTQVADNTPVTITSSSTFTVSEGDALAVNITASEPVGWSVSGGADAAQFTIDGGGVLRGGPFSYSAPADAGANNVYNVTVTANPFATSKANVSQAITITVTEDTVGGAFIDTFTGTNGTDIAANNPLWTRATGPAGAITINGNTAVNNPGVARATYLAPQQGNTRNQHVRWTMPTTSNKCEVVSLWEDDTNYLRISPQGSAGTYSLGKIINGVFSSSVGTLYKAWAAGDVWDSIIDGNTYKLFQNNVLIGTMDITGLLTGARRVGLRSSTTSGAVNGIDNFEAREYTGNYVQKVALSALTMTPLTGNTTSQYVGNLSGRTVGSTISLSSVTPNNEGWIADGDFIRRNAGGTAGTYTVVVAETLLNAVNSGRTTTFTVAIS